MKYRLQLLICLIIILVPTCWTLRFGSRPRTLNIDPNLDVQPKSKIRHIELPNDSIDDNDDVELLDLMEEYDKTLDSTRSKRTIHSGNNGFNSQVKLNNFTIHERHNHALIAWSGQTDSNTIVMVFTDSFVSNTSSSKVYVSYDYGKTYTNQTQHFKLGNGDYARVDYFIDSPDDYRKYLFVCSSNRAIFVSMDEARSFHRYDLNFVPSVVRTHPNYGNLLIARDETDIVNQAYISQNFGKTWISIGDLLFHNEYIEAIVFGSNFDQNSTLYIQVYDPTTNISNVFRTYFNLTIRTQFINDVIEFDVASEYMFATRVNPLNDTDIILLVSFDGGSFQRALFSSEGKNERSYYIADGSEGQLFVAVNHYSNLTNLYISGVRGIEFSLSLERVLYHDPKLADVSSSWVYYSTSSKLLDLHIVQGLRGIYIATQLTEATVGHRYLRTYISYDKGGVWKRLTPPSLDYRNRTIICEPPCYLNLAQQFSSIYPSYYKSENIYSRKSSPGIIMASGSIGVNLYLISHLMVSNTAGNTWFYSLPFFHYYQMMDHGGVLVAGFKYYIRTSFIFYSLDEGANWYQFSFSTVKVYIWGMYTEPGEQTSILTIYTSAVGIYEWLLFRVDFKNVLGNNCTALQYYSWSPSDDIPDRDCLLGSLVFYDRKLTSEVCYQGLYYERPTNTSICGCTREDFECDFGFGQEDSDAGCIPEDENPLFLIPDTCHPEQMYNRSRGYRLIAGDVCINGDAKFYLPVIETCPPVPSNITMTIVGGQSRTDGLFEIQNLKQVKFVAKIFAIDNNIVITDTYWSVGSGFEHYNTSQMTLDYSFSSTGEYRVVVKFYSKIYSVTFQTVVYVVSSLTDAEQLFSLDLLNYTFSGASSHLHLLVPNNVSDFGNLTYAWSFNGSTDCKVSRTPYLSATFNSEGLTSVSVKISNSFSYLKLHSSLMVYSPITVNQFATQYIGANQVILTWDFKAVQISGYEIFIMTGSDVKSVYNLNQNKWHVIDNLLSSTQYSFKVKILSDYHYMPPSSSLTVATLDSPKIGQPPLNLKIVQHSSMSIMASWDPPSNSVSASISKYQLYIFSSSGFVSNLVQSTSYIFNYAMNDTFYFQVAAYSSDSSYLMTLSSRVMYNTMLTSCGCNCPSSNPTTTHSMNPSHSMSTSTKSSNASSTNYKPTPTHSNSSSTNYKPTPTNSNSSSNNCPQNSGAIGASGTTINIFVAIVVIVSIIFNLIFITVIISLFVTLYRVNKLRTQRYHILSHFNAEEEEVVVGAENLNYEGSDNLILEANTVRVPINENLTNDFNDDDDFILNSDIKDENNPLL